MFCQSRALGGMRHVCAGDVPPRGDAVGLATLMVPRRRLRGHVLTAGKSQTRFSAFPVILNHGNLCSRYLTISSKHTYRNRKSEQDGAQRRHAREQSPQSPQSSPRFPPSAGLREEALSRSSQEKEEGRKGQESWRSGLDRASAADGQGDTCRPRCEGSDWEKQESGVSPPPECARISVTAWGRRGGGTETGRARGIAGC